MHSLDLDSCIEKLHKRELLREEILEAICEQVKQVLMRESNVVHVHAPITVVGDIHGYPPPPRRWLVLREETVSGLVGDFPNRWIGARDELSVSGGLCGPG